MAKLKDLNGTLYDLMYAVTIHSLVRCNLFFLKKCTRKKMKRLLKSAFEILDHRLKEAHYTILLFQPLSIQNHRKREIPAIHVANILCCRIPQFFPVFRENLVNHYRVRVVKLVINFCMAGKSTGKNTAHQLRYDLLPV